MINAMYLLYRHLHSYNARLLLRNPQISNFTRSQVLTSAQNHISKDCLYILVSTDELDCEILQQDGNFLFLSVQESFAEEMFSSNSNIIVLDKVKEESVIYSAVSHCCTALEKLYKHYPFILNAILKKEDTLQLLMNILADMLNNPVALLSFQYDIIARSTPVITNDISWNDLVNQGKLTEENLYMEKHSYNIIDYKENYDYPFLFTFDPYLPRLTALVNIKNAEPYNMLVLQNNKRFTQSDYVVLYAFTQIISSYLSQNNYNITAKRNPSLTEVYKGIISGEIESNMESIIKYKLDSNSKAKPYHYVLKLSQKTSVDSMHTLLQCIKSISSYSTCTSFTYKNSIVVIISCDKELTDYLENLTIKKINDQWGKQFFISISLPFSSISFLKEAFSQCEIAESYGAKMVKVTDRSMIFEYKTYMYSDYIDSICKKIPAQNFIILKVHEIVSYDAANDTEFATTIYQYFRHYMNNNATAQALNLHRNTVSYRLQRVSDLFNIDFSDYTACKNLELSFELYFNLFS